MKGKQTALILSQLLACSCVLTACGGTAKDSADSSAAREAEEAASRTESEQSVQTTEETEETSGEMESSLAEETSSAEKDNSAADSSGQEDTDAKDISYYRDQVYGGILEDCRLLASETLKAAQDPDYNSDSIRDLADMPGFTGVSEFIYTNPDTAKDQLGYLLQDFSGDGIPELLIGYSEENMPSDQRDCMIFALYTSVDDQPVEVCDGWYRNCYYPISRNRFGYYGSGGADSSAFGAFALSYDGTSPVWEDFYFSDFDPEDAQTILYFHNTSGEWDQQNSERLEISSDEFWQKEDAYTSDAVSLPFDKLW